MTFVTPVESLFHFSFISVQEVFDALNQLNLRKSPGRDGISVKLLRDTSNVIVHALANIFNLSFQTAIFQTGKSPRYHQSLRKGIKLFKEGNKTDCRNYTPISVRASIQSIENIYYRQ
jgi:hypothetical protein